MTLLQRLRERTAEAHRCIEATVDLPARMRSLGSYTDLLARFHGFYVSWEPRVIAAVGTSVYGEARHKLELLKQDLRALGLPDEAIARLPVCQQLPALATRAQALGSMYVLEGATLGGKIISRMAQQRLGLTPAHGCRYFHGHGAQTDSMWREFGALVQTRASNADEAEVIESAQATFDCLRTWLADDGQVVAPRPSPAIKSDRNDPRSSPSSTL